MSTQYMYSSEYLTRLLIFNYAILCFSNIIYFKHISIYNPVLSLFFIYSQYLKFFLYYFMTKIQNFRLITYQ